MTTDTGQRSALIQTATVMGLTPPPPFRVDLVGNVTGRPRSSASEAERLVGFTSRMDRYDLDLELSDFWTEPDRAVGMYPVTADDHGYWATHVLSVEWVLPEPDRTESA